MRKALISVFDKRGIVELAQKLISEGFEIIASNGTCNYLKQYNIESTFISDFTQFEEILGGRVKTLHPKIYANILNIEENTSETIDVIVVNLYPFHDNACIENIDIGGVSLIRASAKNYKHKIILTDPDQYSSYINKSVDNKKLASEAFKLTQEYDMAIMKWLD